MKSRHALTILVAVLILAGYSPATAQSSRQKRYIKRVAQPLCVTPGGRKRGELYASAPVTIKESRGDWVKVRVEGWVSASSLSAPGQKISVADAVGKSSSQLRVQSFAVEEIAPEGGGRRKVFVKLTLNNRSRKVVSSWSALLVARDKKSGSVLFSEPLSDDRTPINPRQSVEVRFFWEPDEQPFSVLLSAARKRQLLELELVKVQLNK